jgi:hypothetical protein
MVIESTDDFGTKEETAEFAPSITEVIASVTRLLGPAAGTLRGFGFAGGHEHDRAVWFRLPVAGNPRDPVWSAGLCMNLIRAA